MDKLLKLNVTNKNEKFNEFLKSGILNMKDEKAYPVLAGGAMRSFINKTEDPNDFDLFIVGDSPELKAKILAFCDTNYENIFRCPQELMYTYKTPFGKLQLICPKIYTSIEDLLDSFDITAGRSAYDGTVLCTFKSFIKSVKKKVLSFHKISFPLATMNRMYKYKSYGYSIYEASEQFLREVNGGFFPEDNLFVHYID